MKYTLEIVCDGAAFEPPYLEIAKILEKIAQNMYEDAEALTYPLYDTNGNRCGHVYVDYGDCTYCDNCGNVILEGDGVFIEALTMPVESANVGESASLCNSCGAAHI